MNNPTKRLIVIIFFALLTVMGALFYLMPDKPTFSEQENRLLAEPPELTADALLSGTFTAEYDAYYSDNFPYREKLINIANLIREDLRSVGGNDGYQLVVLDGEGDPDGDFGEPEVSDSDVSGSDAALEDEIPKDVALDGGYWNKSYLVCDDTVLTLPRQVPSSEAAQHAFAQMVNDTQQKYPQTNVYCAIAPISSAYYLPTELRTPERDQTVMINTVYNDLIPPVQSVDIYSALERHSDEYIYFRTDHHWTGLGAYYAYEQFLRTAGKGDAVPLDELQSVSYDKFLGTLYKEVGGNSAMRANPDTVICYDIPGPYTATYHYKDGRTKREKPLVALDYEGSTKYSAFTYGDNPLIVVETEHEDCGNILVFKDSYGNAFVPFLAMSYERVIVADPRYPIPSVTELVETYEVDNILFLYNLNNITHQYRVYEYNKLLNK